MTKADLEKRWEKEARRMMGLLRDMDMKLNHIIERLRQINLYLNSINSVNSK